MTDFDPRSVIGWMTGVVSTAVIGWIGIVRRIDSKISRTEFNDSIERRDTRIRDDLREVLTKLDEQNEKSAEWRALTADKLQRVSEEIAVIKDRASRHRDSRQ